MFQNLTRRTWLNLIKDGVRQHFFCCGWLSPNFLICRNLDRKSTDQKSENTKYKIQCQIIWHCILSDPGKGGIMCVGPEQAYSCPHQLSSPYQCRINTKTIQILCKYYTNTIQILYKYYTNNIQILYKTIEIL